MKAGSAWIMLLMGVALSGCMDGGSIREQNTVLAYEGEQSGEHEKTARCGEDGRISGSGDVEDGQLTVMVHDADHNEIFKKEYNAEFDLAAEDVRGAPGTWIVRAERSGNDLAGDEFNGRYTFTMNC